MKINTIDSGKKAGVNIFPLNHTTGNSKNEVTFNGNESGDFQVAGLLMSCKLEISVHISVRNSLLIIHFLHPDQRVSLF